MNCLRSFSIQIDNNLNFSTAGTNVKTWGAIGNYHWVVIQQGLSTFNIQGFKRIDLYGMQMTGTVQTDAGAADGAIVEDYSFSVGIVGQVPLVGGIKTVAPDFWNIGQQVTNYNLGKFSNSVMFETPYTGLSALAFQEFRAQGNNAETLNSVSLDIKLEFVFYYKFDGE